MNNETYWFGGTCNTLKASRWTVLMARLFGRRVEGEDLGCRCVGYQWRGRLYLTEFNRPPLSSGAPDAMATIAPTTALILALLGRRNRMAYWQAFSDGFLFGVMFCTAAVLLVFHKQKSRSPRS